MQKILLLGEYNTILKNIYNAMCKIYQVQICNNTSNDIKNMLDLTEPDLILISTYGMSNSDIQVVEYFQRDDKKIPVVMVGTYEECKEYINSYDAGWFGFVERPATRNDLINKCRKMLEMTGQNRQEESGEDQEDRKKILIVDDNGVFLRNARSILEASYTIFVAKSGEKGLEIAIKEQPDLILLDYDMPGWNGKNTLENLRNIEETTNIPVIFLTGVADRNHIVDVLKLQPQGYILKPVDREGLKQKIVDFFDEPV